MQPIFSVSITAVLLAAGIVGCSTPRPPVAVETGAPLTAEGLVPVVRSGFALAWLRPGTRFDVYDRFRARSDGIFYRSPPGRSRDRLGGLGGDNFALPDEMKKSLEASLGETFDREVQRGGDWRLANANGPGTLIFRLALGDLVVHTPLDANGGDDLVWVDSVGEFTIRVEIYDSETGTLIGRILDRQAIATGLNRPIRVTVGAANYQANRVFRSWAARLRELLDVLRDGEIAGQFRIRGADGELAGSEALPRGMASGSAVPEARSRAPGLSLTLRASPESR